MDKQRNKRQLPQWEAIKVHNGIVYDADKSEILYEADLGGVVMIRLFLAVTPDGNFFQIQARRSFVIFFDISITPLDIRQAIQWAVTYDAPNEILERIGVTALPDAGVPPDKPFEEVDNCEVLFAKKKLLTNRIIHWDEFLCRNPDGRLFRYDEMKFFNTLAYKERRAMTQREALKWVIKHGASRHDLRHLGLRQLNATWRVENDGEQQNLG